MDMTGEVRIPASREVVWAALNDPATLRVCIPGCEELNVQSATEMTAVVVIRIGPVSSRFRCAVTLSELVPPESYRITGEGQGGVAGHARGGAVVSLKADGTETVLSYTFSAQVGGKLAQLGSRMIDASAKMLSAVFFKNLARQIEAQHEGQFTKSQQASASDESPPTRVATTAARSPVSTVARADGTESERTVRRIAFAALAIAVLALLLAWRAIGQPVATGSTFLPHTSAEFNTAVQLLVVLAIGYLLGRVGLGDRHSQDTRTSRIDL